jgi:hypothetical protein
MQLRSGAGFVAPTVGGLPPDAKTRRMPKTWAKAPLAARELTSRRRQTIAFGDWSVGGRRHGADECGGSQGGARVMPADQDTGRVKQPGPGSLKRPNPVGIIKLRQRRYRLRLLAPSAGESFGNGSGT